MKKLLFLAILSAIIYSCQKDQNHDNPGINLISDKKAALLIESDSKFGLELFQKTTKMEEAPENLMISPVSVAVALGMTYNGANSDTKTAFEETLGFSGFSREEINSIHKELTRQIITSDPKVIMEIANSIWYKRGFSVLPSFLQINEEYYDAEVADLVFSDPASLDIINNWCAEKTHDKIKNVLDGISEDAVMYLINAIYFNGIWTYQFDESKSYNSTFLKEDGSCSDASYMQLQEDIAYLRNDLFTAIDLPYGNEKFSMSIFLPRAGKSTEDIIMAMNSGGLSTWIQDFEKKNLVVTLPKFKFGYKELLNQPLIDMGLGIAFSDDADFSGINDAGNLTISRVIHQSFIDVNEKGTEAAAVTVVEIEVTSVNPDEDDSRFTADHPFIFMIREKSTNALLFIGKVGHPVYEP